MILILAPKMRTHGHGICPSLLKQDLRNARPHVSHSNVMLATLQCDNPQVCCLPCIGLDLIADMLLVCATFPSTPCLLVCHAASAIEI